MNAASNGCYKLLPEHTSQLRVVDQQFHSVSVRAAAKSSRRPVPVELVLRHRPTGKEGQLPCYRSNLLSLWENMVSISISRRVLSEGILNDGVRRCCGQDFVHFHRFAFQLLVILKKPANHD